MRCLICLLIAATMSCSRTEDGNTTDAVAHDLRVVAGSILKFDIYRGSIPVEGYTEITKAPKHAVESEIRFEETSVFYVYQSKSDFVGTETVVLDQFYSIGDANYQPGGKIKLIIEVVEGK